MHALASCNCVTITIIIVGDVTVMCNQTGRNMIVKASRLSLDDGDDVKESHLTFGTQLAVT